MMIISDLEDFNKYGWNYLDAIEDVKAKGFTVVQATSTTILLDLDDEASVEHYEAMLPILSYSFDLKELSRYQSKSGKGTHVILSCQDTDTATRIALQAVLGSDRKREALALMMVASDIENPSWLFKPPVK